MGRHSDFNGDRDILQILTLTDNLSLNRNLEKRVKERTQQLEEAAQHLSESFNLQDQFVANTSHELRTPLTVIKGTLQTLLRPELT